MNPTKHSLEPGWLARQVYSATISLMSSAGPETYPNSSFAAVSDAEAADLFAMMDRRFHAWTGKSLAEQIATLTAGQRQNEG